MEGFQRPRTLMRSTRSVAKFFDRSRPTEMKTVNSLRLAVRLSYFRRVTRFLRSVCCASDGLSCRLGMRADRAKDWMEEKVLQIGNM